MHTRKRPAAGLDSDRQWGVLLPITDPADPRLGDYRELTDVALRTRVEPAGGLYIAEGELVLRRAVAARHRIRSVLAEDRRAAELAAMVGPEVPVYAGSRAVLAEVSGFDVHRGLLAAVQRPAEPAVGALLAAGCRVVVLEDLTNPTNVGAVLRCAAALGMDAALLSPRCADPWYRRSVRVSMGAVFALPHARLADWPGGLAPLRAAGFQLLGLSPDPAGTALDRLRAPAGTRIAVLLGTEGSGLSEPALGGCDRLVRIPMARGVDSLNVAAAAAVACYALGRRD